LSFLLPPIDTWEQWAASYNDVRLWRPVVDAICTREGIGYRHIEAPESNTNAVFILDARLVIKIYSPFSAEFAFERALIERLARDGEVPVPAIRAAGVFRDRRDWSYLAMEFCAGCPLDTLRPRITKESAQSPRDIDDNRQPSIARASANTEASPSSRLLSDQGLLKIAGHTGRLLRRLHAVDLEPLVGIDNGERWESLVHRRRRRVVPELIDMRLIEPAITPALEQLLDEALAASQTAPRVVVHGDLNAEHLLVEQRDGSWTVSALIDFGDARIGVSDYEWMPLWLGLCNRDATVMRAFLAAYDRSLASDPRLGRRIAAWTLLHEFGTDAIAEVFDHTGATRPAPSLQALQRLLWPGMWQDGRHE
jgi:hygromycin-B 7''-O-kinase